MSIRQRPESFRIDYTSPLARGLVFAGLGQCPGSVMYKDSSSRRNNGTLTNMVPADDWVWVDELGRWGLDFDGFNDHVETIRNIGITGAQSRTISCFVSGTPVDYAPVWGFGAAVAGQEFTLMDDNEDGIRLGVTSGYVTFAPEISSATKHIAIVLPSGSSNVTDVACWVDGVAYPSVRSSARTINTAASALKIGANPTGLYYGNYRITDPLIHDRALSPAEIAILANRSDPMLGGLLLPPKRKLYAVRSTLYSRHYFLLQSNLGKSLLRLTS